MRYWIKIKNQVKKIIKRDKNPPKITNKTLLKLIQKL